MIDLQKQMKQAFISLNQS